MRASAAPAAGLVRARRKLGNVRGNIQRRYVNRVLCLGHLDHTKPDGKQEQRNDGRVRKDRQHLAGTEIFVFRPDLFDLDGLDAWRQRRLLRRREEFLDASAESAEARSPRNRQAAVHATILERVRAEKFREIAGEPGTERSLRKGRIFAPANFNGALGQELPEVRPKIIGHQNRGPAEPRNIGRPRWSRRLRSRPGHVRPLRRRWHKFVDFARHRIPLSIDA